MRVRATVPALRDDLTLVPMGDRVALEDATRHIRLPIDDLGQALCRALEAGPKTPDELVASLGAGRLEIYKRVSLLNRHGMLDTPRSRANIELYREDARTQEPSDGRLHHDGGLRHTCVGCGGCCTGTDLGPLSPEDVARIVAVDWSPHLPDDVTPDDWFTQVEMEGGETFTLLGRRDDRCVFLRRDNKCTIHAEAGAAQKPLMCRQFPHIFLQEPGSQSIHVGLATECRAWHVARVDGHTVEEITDDLRELLVEKGKAIVLSDPVSVWDGLDWSWSDWSRVRALQLDALRSAEDFGGLIEAVVAPVTAELRRSMEPWEDDELFATRAGWGIPAPPTGPLANSGAIKDFQAARDKLDGVIASGLADLADRYDGAGEGAMARRHRALADSVAHLLSGVLAPPAASDPVALDLWREMAIAAVDSHEIVRSGSVLEGTAALVFKLVLARHDCLLGVSDDLRARVEAQDVVDRMVRVTKMLRGALVSALLRRIRGDLVALFLFNASVFARGTAPRALGLDAATRLPGALR